MQPSAQEFNDKDALKRVIRSLSGPTNGREFLLTLLEKQGVEAVLNFTTRANSKDHKITHLKQLNNVEQSILKFLPEQRQSRREFGIRLAATRVAIFTGVTGTLAFFDPEASDLEKTATLSAFLLALTTRHKANNAITAHQLETAISVAGELHFQIEIAKNNEGRFF